MSMSNSRMFQKMKLPNQAIKEKEEKKIEQDLSDLRTWVKGRLNQLQSNMEEEEKNHDTRMSDAKKLNNKLKSEYGIDEKEEVGAIRARALVDRKESEVAIRGLNENIKEMEGRLKPNMDPQEERKLKTFLTEAKDELSKQKEFLQNANQCLKEVDELKSRLADIDAGMKYIEKINDLQKELIDAASKLPDLKTLKEQSSTSLFYSLKMDPNYSKLLGVFREYDKDWEKVSKLANYGRNAQGDPLSFTELKEIMDKKMLYIAISKNEAGISPTDLLTKVFPVDKSNPNPMIMCRFTNVGLTIPGAAATLSMGTIVGKQRTPENYVYYAIPIPNRHKDKVEVSSEYELPSVMIHKDTLTEILKNADQIKVHKLPAMDEPIEQKAPSIRGPGR